jgi:NAD(P)-dependent dehydrogenase (short-subunit alcohol dehydrogenase family)
MDLQLTGKRALITGSTAGIGYAIAEALFREGAHVIVNGRKQARVDAALQSLAQSRLSGRAEGLAADLGTVEGAAAATARYPELDILVNNLGIFEPKPFEEIRDADWLRFFEINVLSGVRLSRHYLPGMKQRDWGRILFVSSESGVQIPAEMIHYGMTKTAQLAISRGLAETTVGTNVTVNTILPGPTASEGALDFLKSLADQTKQSHADFEDEFFRSVRPTSLLKRMEKPEEIAAMAAFLLQPAGLGYKRCSRPGRRRRCAFSRLNALRKLASGARRAHSRRTEPGRTYSLG